MPRKSTSTKDARRRYSCEYKSEALALAAQVGVSEAPAQRKLATSQLYNCAPRLRRVGNVRNLSKPLPRRTHDSNVYWPKKNKR